MTLESTSDRTDLQQGASEVSSDGEKASAAWRRTLDGTERRVHHQEERGDDAHLVDRAHGALLLRHGRRHAHTFGTGANLGTERYHGRASAGKMCLPEVRDVL